MRLTRRHKNVLAFLERLDGWCAPSRLPGGNGRSGCATAATLRDLRGENLIEYGKEPAHSYYGYRITPAGRAALDAEGER